MQNQSLPNEPGGFQQIDGSQVAINPDDPPWNGWIALGTLLVSILLIMIVPAIAVAPYALQNQEKFSSGDQMAEFLIKDPTALFIQIAGIIPAHVLTVALAWLVVTRGNRYPFFETLGWKSGGVKWWHYMLIFISLIGIAVIIGLILPFKETDMDLLLKSSRNAVLIGAFMATFTAPFVEEVIYRGVFYSAVQRRFGATLAVLTVTAIFLGVHVYQYRQSPSTILVIGLFSLSLTLVRVYSGNLWPCIVLHTIINGSQSLLLVAEPYLNIQSPNPIEKTAAVLHMLK